MLDVCLVSGHRSTRRKGSQSVQRMSDECGLAAPCGTPLSVDDVRRETRRRSADFSYALLALMRIANKAILHIITRREPRIAGSARARKGDLSVCVHKQATRKSHQDLCVPGRPSYNWCAPFLHSIVSIPFLISGLSPSLSHSAGGASCGAAALQTLVKGDQHGNGVRRQLHTCTGG